MRLCTIFTRAGNCAGSGNCTEKEQAAGCSKLRREKEQVTGLSNLYREKKLQAFQKIAQVVRTNGRPFKITQEHRKFVAAFQNRKIAAESGETI